jgi:hypothetical protein
VKCNFHRSIIIGGYFYKTAPKLTYLPFSSRSAPATNVHPIETGYCHLSLLRNGNYHDISGFNAIRFSIVNSVSVKEGCRSSTLLNSKLLNLSKNWINEDNKQQQ